MEIGDYVFIYFGDELRWFEVKTNNRDTHRVERKIGKLYNAFTIKKKDEGIDWFPSRASALNYMLDTEYNNILKLKHSVERQKKKLDALIAKHNSKT